MKNESRGQGFIEPSKYHMTFLGKVKAKRLVKGLTLLLKSLMK